MTFGSDNNELLNYQADRERFITLNQGIRLEEMQKIT
jgi:hypothetical protein